MYFSNISKNFFNFIFMNLPTTRIINFDIFRVPEYSARQHLDTFLGQFNLPLVASGIYQNNTGNFRIYADRIGPDFRACPINEPRLRGCCQRRDNELLIHAWQIDNSSWPRLFGGTFPPLPWNFVTSIVITSY